MSVEAALSISCCDVSSNVSELVGVQLLGCDGEHPALGAGGEQPVLGAVHGVSCAVHVAPGAAIVASLDWTGMVTFHIALPVGTGVRTLPGISCSS